MSHELPIGLIGCGRLAQLGYLPALAAAAGVRLAAVADPDPARREQAAAAGAVPAFESAAALLDAAAARAVVIVTPAEAHVADARLAAADGIPALVEKPPAPDAAGAEALAALDPPPWIGFNRRFTPGVAAVRAAVGTGDRQVELLLELHYRRQSWGAHTVGDEALLDLGPHLVDLARFVSGGEVTGVRTATRSHDRAEFELDLERGQARVRCACDRPHRERVEAHDAGGTLLARHREGGLVAGLRARMTSRGAAHPLVASLTAQLEAFARTIAGDRHPALATAADGHAAMAVIDAVRACAAGGKRTDPVAA